MFADVDAIVAGRARDTQVSDTVDMDVRRVGHESPDKQVAEPLAEEQVAVGINRQTNKTSAYEVQRITGRGGCAGMIDDIDEAAIAIACVRRAVGIETEGVMTLYPLTPGRQ